MSRGAKGTNRERMAITLAMRDARRRTGFTQAEFSKHLGVGRPMVAMWENGHALPSLIAYARALTMGDGADDAGSAIRDMEFMRQTHVKWAEHFEAHPEVEARYVATGEWSSAAEHRKIVAQYDRVIRLLSRLAPCCTPTPPPE